MNQDYTNFVIFELEHWSSLELELEFKYTQNLLGLLQPIN